MKKEDIIIFIVLTVIFFVIFYIAFYKLFGKNIGTSKNMPINITFYPNPYQYNANYVNNTLYLNITDYQLPYINTSNFILNITENIYNLTCGKEIIYTNQSVLCYVKNIIIENNTMIQLLYPFNNVLYNIEYNITT
ncbi:putative secreted or membrane protein [Candidatus Nanobsidianus stetteri]|uniref:Putative secreted or membrane protein n=1 Tax=Nanobsidianus stetteri TaxID=1294122 RepID=R1G9X3_NANST|nr:putative secreted or membrane protein [Candidatus Nanobsidianus stetteri]